MEAPDWDSGARDLSYGPECEFCVVHTDVAVLNGNGNGSFDLMTG